MEMQEIVIIGESIKLVSWVLIGFYELLLFEERFLTIFEDMRNMVYGRLEHFKGGSTL